MTDKDAPLSRKEFEALRDISRGPAELTIPVNIWQRLLDLQFIKQVGRQRSVTNIGKIRLGRGK
jgi:hypothetical protein